MIVKQNDIKPWRSALLVDVAGGKGQDLQAFHSIFQKDYTGELMLQKIKSALDGIKDEELDQTVSRMEQDGA